MSEGDYVIMYNSKKPNSKSILDKFFHMMDFLAKWTNRISTIAQVAIVVILIVAIVWQFIVSNHNGWSLFNKQTEISIDNQYYETGIRFLEELDYKKAEENLKAALEQISQLEGEDTLKAAIVSQKLGCLYLDLGRYEESYELLNSAYITFYDKLGVKDGNTVIAKCQISVYDIRIGNTERGFATLNEMFDDVKYIPYKMQIVQMIAQCHMLQGNYKEALQWYKQLETIYGNIGCTDLNLVTLYNDFGVLLIKIGEYEQALRYLTMAAQQWQSLNVTEDLTIANVYLNMAKALAFCAQYENAAAYVEKALSIFQLMDKNKNIHIAKAYENLAMVYGNMRKYDIQIEYLEKALDTATSIVGKNHDVTAEIYNTMGTCYLNRNEIQSAIDNYEEALEIRKNLIGKNSLVTADVYLNLAKCYNCKGQYEKGLENAKEAVTICESLCGRDNINTAHSYINLAWIDEQMGNEQEAGRLVRIVLDIIDRHKITNNEMMAQIYLTVGDIYLDQECFEAASDYYWKSWQTYLEIFSDKSIYESEFDDRLEKLYNNLKISKDYVRWIECWKTGET